MTKKFFPSKILLFGEYTVTHGSGALAIPFFGKSAYWSGPSDVVDEDLLAFHVYLAEHHSDILYTDRFYKDILNGWCISSDIPRGYGLGSSGALVAAIFDKYGVAQPDETKMLKQWLSAMECFFHGKSSGIDPMVSYLKEPVYMAEGEVRKVSIPPVQNAQIFLLDSFHSRNTEHWVQHFQQKLLKDQTFQKEVVNLSFLNEKMIESYLSGDPAIFWETGKKISRCQFHFFREFIPETHQNIWENSLLRDDLFLKLCGAGGGGYTLGFAKNMDSVFMDTIAFNPTWIY